MLTVPAEFSSLALTAPDGAHAEIALDGAHVVAWVPAGETDNRLFVSARSNFGPGASIRGGIPIIFPQFGKFGPLQQHGFARNVRWRVPPGDATDAGHARLVLTDSEVTRALWPHAFALTLDVHVAGDSLTVALNARNTDSAPFTFTSAFHPYFAMQDALTSHVDGLAACMYRDALQHGAMVAETHPSIAITEALDRVYYSAPDTLVIRDGVRALHIEKHGFPEAVIWNPGESGTRGRADFVPGDEHRMLCVEAACIANPVTLAPGEVWTGVQTMRAR